MPEQETSATSFSQDSLASISWRERVCRLLFRALLYIWGTLIVGIVIGTIANINTTPTDTTLSKLFIIHLALTFPIPVFSSLGFLVLLTLLFWLGSRNRVATVAPSLSEQNRTYMLRRLRLRYEQMLTQSLQGAVQIELGLASKPTAVQNAISLSLRLPDQPEQALPSHISISEAYGLAHQELLILGEPGAGKSTLLLELVFHLTQQAEQNATQPLPILLPLSSWAVRRPSLKDWLSEQFALLYDVPRNLSQQWIQGEHLLPLLDGLDEMEGSARAACIAAINTYHREHLQPLVVSSRTNEYEMAARRERLSLHTAVVVQPLSKEQIDAHLVNMGKPVAALRAALRKNPILLELATTPLMLQVLLLTYHGTSVRELSQKETLLRQQIWNDYVQHMISRKGDVKRYPLHVSSAWLSWLAQEMREHNQTIFSLEQLQPNWLPTRQRVFYRWSTGLVAGLVFVLVGGLVSVLGVGLSKGLVGGLVSGLVGGLSKGLVVGLVGGLVVGLETKIEPAEVVAWSGKYLRRRLVVLLVGGLVGGLAFGLIFGLGGGVISVLIGVLIFGFSREQLTERLLLSPNEGIRRSIKNGLVVGLVGGLVVGLVVGLMVVVLFGVLVGGLVFGLVGGLGAAMQHYILRFWLWRTRTFPWKVVPFLDDATARILLRRVGGGYSFIHRLLLDHFADLNADGPSASTSAPPISPPVP